VFFELLEHLNLLLAEVKTVKGSLIAISNVEIAEEPLYVIEIERDEGSPSYSVLPHSPWNLREPSAYNSFATSFIFELPR
jgi:hypothetical protein